MAPSVVIAAGLAAVLAVLNTAAAQRTGYWQCSATSNANGLFNIPVKWTCEMADNCCLTGRQDKTPGCCKQFKYEAVYVQEPTYISCSPAGRRQYFCPGNRECCVIATTGGGNKTGCCISHTATDAPSTGSGHFAERSSSSGLSADTVIIIVIAVLFVVVLGCGLLGYYISMARRQAVRSRHGIIRMQVGDSVSDDMAAIVAPPSYWQTTDTSVPQTSAPSSGDTSQSPPPPLALTPSEVETQQVRQLPRVLNFLNSSRGLPDYTRLPQADEVAVSSNVVTDVDDKESNPEKGIVDV